MGGWEALASVISAVAPMAHQNWAMNRNYKNQINAYQNSILWRTKDAKRAGIHPLAAIGAPSFSPAPTQVQSGSLEKLGDIFKKDITKKQIELIDAEIGLKNAQAESFRNMGQGGTDIAGSTGSKMGQGDTPIGHSGLSEIGPAQAYRETVDGRVYLIANQSAQEAFSDEGTWQNRIVYQLNDANFVRKINNLRENWSNPDPEVQDLKYKFFKTRPVDKTGQGRVALWNGLQWQFFKYPPKGSGDIFTAGHVVMEAYNKKRKYKVRKKAHVYKAPKFTGRY